MKRAFDFALSLLLLPPGLICCLLVLPIIAFDCRATPVFTQRRVGRAQRPFTIYKLRTMRADTADGASHDIGTAYVTRSGKWLRRLKFDELPQLINVVRGDMSFVGPRPCLLSQTELIAARAQHGVFSLRPGITGPAQVAGIDMSTPQLLAEIDATYLGPWRLRRDLNLMLATAFGGGRGDAAAKPPPQA